MRWFFRGSVTQSDSVNELRVICAIVEEWR